MTPEAAGNSSTLIAVYGALGGVVISSGIALLTSYLTRRWQRTAAKEEQKAAFDQQVRQERRETYAAYWGAWNVLIRTLERARHDMRVPDRADQARMRIAESEAEWRHQIDPLFLICSKEVLHAGIAHVQTTEVRIAAALRGELLDGAGKSRALSRAMRGDVLGNDNPVPEK